MIDGKRGGEVAASRTHNGGEARGEGIKGRGRGRAPWGEYRGETGAGVEGRQARRGEKYRRGVVVWVQLLARVYIYIAAIYSIFIYIIIYISII